MSVSIIVVTYNSRGDIDACLNSLLTHSPEAEIIVVDSLSTDGTLEHVWQAYPSITAVSAGRNGGYGAGNNIGAGIANGEYLVILNPDTEVQAGWLDPLIEVLEQRPSVGLVTPTILLRGSDERVNTCGNDVHLTGLTFCAGLNEVAPRITAPARSVVAVSGAAFAIRRDIWEQLGGFDERFFMYLEDTDLSLRARRLGYDVLHVPASRVWHRYSVRVSAMKLYHLERNRRLLLGNSLSRRTRLILSPALAMTELVVWAFCIRQGHAYRTAKLRSYGPLWGNRRRHALCRPYTVPVRGTERRMLRAFSARLAPEQLNGSAAVALANRAITAFYVACRTIAIAASR